MQVLVDAGEHVQDDISSSLPTFIANDTLLQSHSVHTLFRALEKSQAKQSLCLTAVWCVGEYGEVSICFALLVNYIASTAK